MDISGVSTIASAANTVLPTTNSGESETSGDIKTSNPKNDIGNHQTKMGFVIHEGLTNQVVVEIKDKKTDELVRQYPSEKLLNIKEEIKKSTGLLFDRKI